MGKGEGRFSPVTHRTWSVNTAPRLEGPGAGQRSARFPLRSAPSAPPGRAALDAGGVLSLVSLQAWGGWGAGSGPRRRGQSKCECRLCNHLAFSPKELKLAFLTVTSLYLQMNMNKFLFERGKQPAGFIDFPNNHVT